MIYTLRTPSKITNPKDISTVDHISLYMRVSPWPPPAVGAVTLELTPAHRIVESPPKMDSGITEKIIEK